MAEQRQGSGGSSEGSGSGRAASGELTCLLRWPEGHQGMELPVVCQERGGTRVSARRECAAADVGTRGWGRASGGWDHGVCMPSMMGA